MNRELSREHGRLLRYYRCRRRVLPTVLQPVGRTEPDLELIKQAEQVTTLVLEGPARRLARIRSTWITGSGRDPRISNLAIIWSGRGRIVAERPFGNAAGRSGDSRNRDSGCRPVARPALVRQLYNSAFYGDSG
jgi:hypothetical protein